MSRKKGFTLVEILVVLVIIGILVAVILPNTLAAINQANLKEDAANLRNIDSAIAVCYAEKQSWTSCNTVALLVSGGYLENTPTCPFGKTYSFAGSDTTGWKSDKTTNHFASWPVTSTHVQ